MYPVHHIMYPINHIMYPYPAYDVPLSIIWCTPIHHMLHPVHHMMEELKNIYWLRAWQIKTSISSQIIIKISAVQSTVQKWAQVININCSKLQILLVYNCTCTWAGCRVGIWFHLSCPLESCVGALTNKIDPDRPRRLGLGELSQRVTSSGSLWRQRNESSWVQHSQHLTPTPTNSCFLFFLSVN